MENNKLSAVTRILIILGGLALIVVLFVPMWRIELQAPQYPEGLMMLIYANKLGGNVDIINGLNHYIGMKTLHDADFPEFRILPWIISFFSLLFIIIGIAGRRRALNFSLLLFIAFGVIAMIDFWRWEYDYGHNLNPDAAIIVPGMAYQPPLIGFKQLLNFGAYSIPDLGGWIFVGVGLILLLTVLFEWFKFKKKRILPDNKISLLLLIVLTLSINSCSTQPEPIKFGKDNCEFCKMTISDNRFGAEVVSNKGKLYKFDDEHCLIAFLHKGILGKHDISGIFFVDYNKPHDLIDVQKAFFLQSPALKSPMNGNIAAFVDEERFNNAAIIFPGNKISWEEMQK